MLVRLALIACAAPALAQPLGAGHLEFDGLDDRVVVREDFFSPALTIEAWVRPRMVNPSYMTGIVSFGSRTKSSFDFGIHGPDASRLRFFINYGQGQVTVRADTPIPLDTWSHVAVTLEPSDPEGGQLAEVRFYLDGEYDGGRFITEAMLPSPEDAILAIGDDYPGASEVFEGGIDEVRIWSIARNEEEIRAAMQHEIDGDTEGLEGCYRLNRCGSVHLDETPNIRHGASGFDWGLGDDSPRFAPARPSRLWCLGLTSTDFVSAAPISGTIDHQLYQINILGPPASGWTDAILRHEDLHVRDAFQCSGDTDLPYVDAEHYITGADEITLDNCASAFYRAVVELPPVVGVTTVRGAANVDDLAVAYVNDIHVSPPLIRQDVDTLGERRVHHGRAVLGWPGVDVLYEHDRPTILRGGRNEIVLAVCSDASTLEPAGVECSLTLEYECLADWSRDGVIDTLDFLDYFVQWNARDAEADLNGDGRVNTRDVMLFISLWSGGCPGEPVS